ncbi:hypothetical protein [uncultured Acetobacteroides sp.]|uniref:hypothetical protein n=1 Tax=uncultured Acetobacteroides sp. TaxID=1760811 RepID=UPI0029F51979|nr:hypothetical protein [uncultured Acetobacteroides sp.]
MDVNELFIGESYPRIPKSSPTFSKTTSKNDENTLTTSVNSLRIKKNIFNTFKNTP